MTLDEAIKVLRQHNEKGTSVLRITRGQALEKDLLAKVLDNCEQLISEKAEYKRLLKAAVDDLKFESQCRNCKHKEYGLNTICKGCRGNSYEWRHADEALALIGEDTNVPASADDTNVGHKSGGWISVNDRLPEAVEEDVNGKIAFSKSVLVYLVYDNGFTYITNDRFRVDSKSWLHEIPGEGCKVTHWMPLPEPPMDGDTNG